MDSVYEGIGYWYNQELDIASAEVVNDFGMVCLLYTDPEQLFLKCWNKDKTVGKVSVSKIKNLKHIIYITKLKSPQQCGTAFRNHLLLCNIFIYHNNVIGFSLKYKKCIDFYTSRK